MKEQRDLKSPRTTLGRHRERGEYDPASIYEILDEALYCNLAIVREGVPLVLPTLHVRSGDQLYVHGAGNSRLLQDAIGSTVSISVSILDALVLARSAFHHSLNFRSVSIFGVARAVEDREEKRTVLAALVEQVLPGRSEDCRPPSDAELDATAVLAIPIAEASAKIRSGPPIEAPGDEQLPHWGGLLPLRMTAGEPLADEHNEPGTPVPSYLSDYGRTGSGR